ncbi:MAG: hypothetical protein B7Z80_02665 [Rhodospirillales bacterium 20-64-7]|nr:MAG: hypothetical protein B7Z80_02665 [Rhodospirillales bacterium 20-64-7]
MVTPLPGKSNKAILKFRESIPFIYEQHLVHKYGFSVLFRDKKNGYVFYEKPLKPVNKATVVPDKTEELSTDVKNELIRKMSRVVDFYGMDVQAHLRQIRCRLNNLAMCHGGEERKFIFQWMDANVVEDQ